MQSAQRNTGSMPLNGTSIAARLGADCEARVTPTAIIIARSVPHRFRQRPCRVAPRGQQIRFRTV